MSIHVDCTTGTYRVTVASKGGVCFVSVTEPVVCSLCSSADGKGFIDVIFRPYQVFIGTVCQFLLSVTRHLGVFVVEEMIFQCGTQFGSELIACGDAQKGRHVVSCLGSIAECRPHAFRDSVEIGLVGNIQFCPEFIFSSQSEILVVIIHTEDGIETPSGLV